MLEEAVKNLFRSIWSSWPNSLKKVSWVLLQVRSFRHFFKRRHALIPQPQPISRGKSFHGIPVLRTNTIAVNAWRFRIGGRPLNLFDLSGGSKDSILFHHSSLTICRLIENLQVSYGYRFKLKFC